MTIDPLYTMALTTGFLGSAHCVGMCGSLVTAFSLTIKKNQAETTAFQLLYNCGRITTYSLVGAIAGWLGSLLAYANVFNGILRFALLASDIFIIIAGLATARLFSHWNILKMDSPGPAKILSRLACRLNRLPTAMAALPLGLLMGFLPCGFAYAMVIMAAQTTSPASGACTMLFFGLGTMPALLLVGGAAQYLKATTRGWMLRAAGLGVTLMGLYNLSGHITMMGWTFSGPLQFLCH